MNKERIQLVIQKMLDEHKKIKSVVRDNDAIEQGGEEYYFTYPDDKYLWSVMKDSGGDNYIFFYPSKDDKSNFLRFGSEELNTLSIQKLKYLFTEVRGKIFGFDDVLDDILGQNESL
jgi:hypothetical protein